MIVHEPMAVTYVDTGTGSRPVPAFDTSWSELDKLRWKAGCIKDRTGVKIRLTTGGATVGGRVLRDAYGWGMAFQGGGSYGYDEMWTFLTGVEVGLTEDFVTRREDKP